jgi:hypothetical protein
MSEAAGHHSRFIGVRRPCPTILDRQDGTPAPGIELACTKIAIELQNLDARHADDCIRRSLETFRDAASADAAFAVFLDADGQHIESVLSPAVISLSVTRRRCAAPRPNPCRG